MFCKNCASEIMPGAKFCLNCGAEAGKDSKYCPNCGSETAPKAVVCFKCGAALSQQELTPKAQSHEKLLSVLSYIGILWLFGLLIKPDKDNPKVKFHVGQGITLSVAYAVAYTVVSIITDFLSLFKVRTLFEYSTPLPIMIFCSLLWLAVFGIYVFYAVYGIIKVCKDETEPLPVIGKFVFYK